MNPLERRTSAATTPAELYDSVAIDSARLVIRRYSTSFGLACRLLDEPVRTHVRNVYALVRVADELVDAPRPGASEEDRRALLATFEEETVAAMARRHSANLIVHAFACTAAECGIGPDLVTPFFDSMRTDLDRHRHDPASFAAYIYGSAEVVGLMCLRTFAHRCPDRLATYEALAPEARRLGAAFQKLNFLRDLAADYHQLGRCYFPDIDPDRLTAAQRDALLDDIDDDLRVAATAIAHLPTGCRRAVRVAHALFVELSHCLRRAPVQLVRTERIRVPGAAKARVVAGELLRGGT